MRNPGMMTIAAAAMLAATVTLPATTVSAQATKTTKTENHLLAAGFVDRPAATAAMQASLGSLPQRKFLRRTRGSAVSYVYADQKNCDCIYVGSQRAYGTYQRDKQARHIADENQMAASDYQDANWDWGPWGGGGFGPWFGGFGPGFGW